MERLKAAAVLLRWQSLLYSIVNQNKFLQCAVWGMLLLAIGGIVTTYFMKTPHKHTRQIEEQIQANHTRQLPVLNTVERLSLTNQLGELVTLDSLKGRPWVANIFFTRCPVVCKQMTRRMEELQDASKDHPTLRLVSITTDPEYDQPEILAEYGREFGADNARWFFLTGEKSEIARTIMKELWLILEENPEGSRQSELDLYTHSLQLVLVDAESRLRATYESHSPDSIEAILADLSKLEAAAVSF